jgi:glycosidase
VLTQCDARLYKSNDEASNAAIRAEYQKKGRDNARTPMHWDTSAHAGFTQPESQPWMTANPSYKDINAAAQYSDPNSVFSCWKSVLEMRKTHPDIFVYGNFELVDESHEQILAYSRTSDDGQIAVVVCNFSKDEVSWSHLKDKVHKVLLSNAGKTEEDFNQETAVLAPYEAMTLLMTSKD